jgi:hypothetical protein
MIFPGRRRGCTKGGGGSGILLWVAVMMLAFPIESLGVAPQRRPNVRVIGISNPVAPSALSFLGSLGAGTKRRIITPHGGGITKDKQRARQAGPRHILGKTSTRDEVKVELTRLSTLPKGSRYALHRRKIAEKALELLDKDAAMRSNEEEDELVRMLKSLGM